MVPKEGLVNEDDSIQLHGTLNFVYLLTEQGFAEGEGSTRIGE